MMDMEGEDRALDLLPADDGLLLITVYNIGKLDEKDAAEVRRAVTIAEETGVHAIMLTSALPEEVQAWQYENNIDGLDYLFADGTAIKAMMRGNPGFMYLKDAVVVDKGRKVLDLNMEQ